MLLRMGLCGGFIAYTNKGLWAFARSGPNGANVNALTLNI